MRLDFLSIELGGAAHLSVGGKAETVLIITEPKAVSYVKASEFTFRYRSK